MKQYIEKIKNDILAVKKLGYKICQGEYRKGDSVCALGASLIISARDEEKSFDFDAGDNSRFASAYFGLPWQDIDCFTAGFDGVDFSIYNYTKTVASIDSFNAGREVAEFCGFQSKPRAETVVVNPPPTAYPVKGEP